MASHGTVNSETMYRVVTILDTGRTHQDGPYSAHGVAKGMRTRILRRNYSRIVDVVVEEAKVTWDSTPSEAVLQKMGFATR